MTVLEIVQKGEAVLRKPAHKIKNIQDPEIQSLIDDMIETMRNANGVGLAAPQIGRDLQLAVIETMAEVDEDGEDVEDSRDLFVIINPVVSWTSKKVVDGIEGCLSILGYVGEVERPFAIIVSYLDRNGKKRRKRFRGWDARIFLHEIDHLHGILYIDKLTAEDRFWSEEEFEAYQEAKKAAAESTSEE